MLTSRLGPSLNDRQSARRNHRFHRFVSIRLIGDEVAGEDLDHAFRSADERCHIKADVNSTRYEALLFYLVTRQSKSKNGPYNRNGFDEALGNAPSSGPY